MQPRTCNRPVADRRNFMKVAAMAVAMGTLGGFDFGKLGLASISPAQAGTEKPIDYKIFNLDLVTLQSGILFRNVGVSYKTYGQLSPDKSNVIVCPSAFGSTHQDVDWLTSAGKVLDPSRYFVISLNMLGNGLSSSPSNAAPPFDGKRYPKVTLTDNLRMQHRLVTEVFGIQKIALVYGWSMGGQQAYHWGALLPDMVERICVVCGSARTSVNNLVFLAGLKAALTADPLWQDEWFAAPPVRGLKAFARVYAGWVLSPAFYRQEIYKKRFPTLEDFLVGGEAFWRQVGVVLHADPERAGCMRRGRRQGTSKADPDELHLPHLLSPGAVSPSRLQMLALRRPTLQLLQP